MREETKNQHQKLKDNSHGIATAVGIFVFVAFGLLSRNDLIFGLVMATVYLFGMNVSVKVSKKYAGKGRGNLTPARLIGAFALGIVAALIVAVVLAIIDPLSIEGDSIIITIIKHFFDSTATIGLLAGVLVGSILYGMERK